MAIIIRCENGKSICTNAYAAGSMPHKVPLGYRSLNR